MKILPSQKRFVANCCLEMGTHVRTAHKDGELLLEPAPRASMPFEGGQDTEF